MEDDLPPFDSALLNRSYGQNGSQRRPQAYYENDLSEIDELIFNP
jgi:hypothetical protein